MATDVPLIYDTVQKDIDLENQTQATLEAWLIHGRPIKTKTKIRRLAKELAKVHELYEKDIGIDVDNIIGGKFTNKINNYQQEIDNLDVAYGLQTNTINKFNQKIDKQTSFLKPIEKEIERVSKQLVKEDKIQSSITSYDEYLKVDGRTKALISNMIRRAL